ncbi:MAG: hypothetical protein ACTSXQ_02165 [Alphaproteobacteria bacterium]
MAFQWLKNIGKNIGNKNRARKGRNRRKKAERISEIEMASADTPNFTVPDVGSLELRQIALNCFNYERGDAVDLILSMTGESAKDQKIIAKLASVKIFKQEIGSFEQFFEMLEDHDRDALEELKTKSEAVTLQNILNNAKANKKGLPPEELSKIKHEIKESQTTEDAQKEYLHLKKELYIKALDKHVIRKRNTAMVTIFRTDTKDTPWDIDNRLFKTPAEKRFDGDNSEHKQNGGGNKKKKPPKKKKESTDRKETKLGYDIGGNHSSLDGYSNNDDDGHLHMTANSPIKKGENRQILPENNVTGQTGITTSRSPQQPAPRPNIFNRIKEGLRRAFPAKTPALALQPVLAMNADTEPASFEASKKSLGFLKKSVFKLKNAYSIVERFAKEHPEQVRILTENLLKQGGKLFAGGEQGQLIPIRARTSNFRALPPGK